MGGNMFDRNVRTNKLDTGGAIMPLPLNLIALIISYVGSHTRFAPNGKLTALTA